MTQSRHRDELASDNTAGICPESLAALEIANSGAAPSYGEDSWTRRVCDRVRELFETDSDVYFVFNGTAANALALAQICQSYHSIVCHRFSHVQTDECGAPELFSNGSRLLPVGGADGKISLTDTASILASQHELHSHKPRAISLTQATELGTVYRPDEIGALCEFARARQMLVQMDGARFANAVAFLQCRPKEITWQLGVDVLCFGGTKNGLAAGELVIFFKRELAYEFDYRLKQAGQLGSKMRFLAAPWFALLTNDLWLRNATRANKSAQKLAGRLQAEAGLHPCYPVESNAVFLQLDQKLAAALESRGWHFYKFVEPDIYRFMCSWAVTDQILDEFVADVKELIGTR
jgi:threonine aldolase